MSVTARIINVQQRRQQQPSPFQWLTLLRFVVVGEASWLMMMMMMMMMILMMMMVQSASSFSWSTTFTVHHCCRHRSPFEAMALDMTIKQDVFFERSSSGDDNEENSQKLHFESNLFYNDFEDSENPSLLYPRLEEKPTVTTTTMSSSPSPSSSSSTTDTSLFSSLLQRKTQLEQSARQVLHQWTTGSAKSYAAFTINESYYSNNGRLSPTILDENGSNSSRDEVQEELPPFDWVRRVSMGTYPLVACGSAYGSIHVANIQSRQLLGVVRGVHYPFLPGADDLLEEDLAKCLYGEYDGGGVLAVAMHGTNNNNIVASAGREGGVKLFKLVFPVAGKDTRRSASCELRFVGEVPGLSKLLVTCLKFNSLGQLYIGGQDGCLRMVDLNDLSYADNDTIYCDAMHVKMLSWSGLQRRVPHPTSSSILSLDISEELDMAATAHVNGDIRIYSLKSDYDGNDASLLGVWNPFHEANARSVAFISSGGPTDSINDDLLWSIVAGGGNGELWLGDIEPSYYADDDTTTTEVTPVINVHSIQQIKPNHHGPVLSLATRPGGILVSAGHDGMLRVTQIRPTPKALYGLGGYKVWLGSICIGSEGRQLVSDGCDDVVMVHDFTVDKDDENRV